MAYGTWVILTFYTSRLPSAVRRHHDAEIPLLLNDVILQYKYISQTISALGL